jgi:hypothetical protein
MKVNLSTDQVREVIETVSTRDYHGNLRANRLDDASNSRTVWTEFTIRCVSSKGSGHKVSLSAMPFNGKERHLTAACWHAHRDVMKELFARYPNAKLSSAMAKYDGRADFLANFEATGYANIGSQMFPVQARDSCDCALERVDA